VAQDRRVARLGEICGSTSAKEARSMWRQVADPLVEDKEGNKRYTTEIVAQNMQMLGSAAGKGGMAKSTEERFPTEEPVSIPDDDIPF